MGFNLDIVSNLETHGGFKCWKKWLRALCEILMDELDGSHSEGIPLFRIAYPGLTILMTISGNPVSSGRSRSVRDIEVVAARPTKKPATCFAREYSGRS